MSIPHEHAVPAAPARKKDHMGLKGRYCMIVTMFMGLGLLVISAVVLMRISYFGNTQVRSMLEAHLQRVVERIDGTFYEMVGLAQQMCADGSVGKKYYDYTQTHDHYERITLASDISEDITEIMFSHRKFSLAGYFDTDDGQKLQVTNFMTFPVRSNAPSVADLPTLLTINGLTFHGIHGSISGLNSKSSISVCKEGSFPNDDTSIYVEFYLDVPDTLNITSLDNEYECTLALLDLKGDIVYASSPVLHVGENLAEQDLLKNAYHVTRKSAFGFSYELMMTHDTYWQYVLGWMKDLLVVFALTALIITLTVTLLYRLIYKPVRLFSEEVETICDGDLTPSEQVFGIHEFDDLFAKIEEMKRRITQLMDDVRSSEKEKRHLKLDNLYYQINPHFLMNALNSLHWLAAMSKQQDIVIYVHHLNKILSYSLGKTREMITLRSEVQVAKSYVELQQARYDFHFTMDVEEGDYLDKPCARLLLQPILENAICHNMNEFGRLRLSMCCKGGTHAYIEISDDGIGIPNLPEEGVSLHADMIEKGIGWKYLQYTLEAYYGDEAQVFIRPVATGGTCVTMLLPVR